MYPVLHENIKYSIIPLLNKFLAFTLRKETIYNVIDTCEGRRKYYFLTTFSEFVLITVKEVTNCHRKLYIL